VLLAAAFVLGTFRPAPLAADPQPGIPVLAQYLQVVATYRSGRTDTAALVIGTWPRTEVSAAIRQLSDRFVRVAPPDPEALSVVVVEAAVLMHTDAAASAYGVGDGVAGDFHLSTARSLVGLLDEVPAMRKLRPADRRVQTKDWLLIAGSIKLHLFALDEAQASFRRALDVAPDDPEVLLALGGYYELRHWHEAFSLAMRGRQPGSTASDRTTARVLDGMRVTNNLNEAARHLARAVAVDASLDEARLRLARVEMLRGKREESGRLLAQLAAQGRDPAMRYLVALLSARLRDEEGAHDAALALYRQAAESIPEAQTARLGLARALERKGAVDEARTALGSLPPLPKDEASHDPWWLYRLAYLPRAAALLGRLRDAVRSP
jgi:tetratricopeptide (TPR) repeat protein